MISGIGACIGIKEKCNVSAIWCYYNADKIGSILHKYFNSASKVRELINLGSVLSINTKDYVKKLKSYGITDMKDCVEFDNLVIHLLNETEEKAETLSDIYEGMVYRIMYGYLYDPRENKWYQVKDSINKRMEELKV